MNNKRRLREVNRLAHAMVASKTPAWFMRDGSLIQAVPTLQEARGVAEDMLRFLDIANGDLASDTLTQGTANALLEAVAAESPDTPKAPPSHRKRRH